MKFLKNFLSFFTSITTAITVNVAIVTIVGDYTEMSKFLALQILGAGAVSALITAAVFSFEFKSKKDYIIKTAVHYILLCIVMNVMGIMFNWTGSDIRGIVMMCVYVALVYVVVYTITYVLYKKEADELNRALKERNDIE